jgi:hypothetical protein
MKIFLLVVAAAAVGACGGSKRDCDAYIKHWNLVDEFSASSADVKRKYCEEASETKYKCMMEAKNHLQVLDCL